MGDEVGAADEDLLTVRAFSGCCGESTMSLCERPALPEPRAGLLKLLMNSLCVELQT